VDLRRSSKPRPLRQVRAVRRKPPDAWIPPALLRFLVLSASAILYKATDYWYPEHERTLLWNDPALGIDWPLSGAPTLAAKDAAGRLLADADVYA
jgi:dTDP-4-dehydrorhamnose 3,5-epimerase